MLAPLAALLLAAAAPDTSWGEIRGRVESDPGGSPLPSAVVEVSAGGQVLTDSSGNYRLAHVAAGPQTVRVRSLDHEPMEVQVYVPARGEVEVVVALRYRPVVLAPVTGVSKGQGGPETDPAPRGEAAITDFPALEGPGTGLEAGRGSSSGNGGSGGDVLLVRGSAANLKLVLLDGAPVYAPFHMGGLIESFEPGLLSSARLYLGGAPARYDGGVSYVLDLATRAPAHDRWTGAVGADMMSVRGQAGGPLWKGAALLLAGRGVHGATLARLEGHPFPYAYGDGLARLDVDLPGGASLSATGFANAEGVRIDTQPWRDNFLRWRNDAGSLRLRGRLTGASAELTAALSDFDAWLPNAADFYVVQSHLRRARVALDLTRDVSGVRLGYGYAYDRLWAHHRVLDRSAGERLWFTRDTFGTVGGWYLDARWGAGRQWVLRGGLRGDMYASGPFISFSPRLSATWLAGRHSTFTLAAGRYHQLVLARIRPPFDYGVHDVADSLGIPTVPVVASSNHLTLAVDHELLPGTLLGLEGYLKHFQDIPDGDEVGDNASGMDVWVRRGEGAVRGWVGYSLAWYWSRVDSVVFNPAAGTGTTRRRILGQRRQTLSAGVTAQGRPGKVELRVAYGAGLPYSSLGAPPGTESATVATPGSFDLTDGSTSLTGVARQDFLRLDGQVSRTFTPRIASRETELTPYVRVINALDRRDALFYRYTPGEDDARPVATLPLLPVVGLEWKF